MFTGTQGCMYIVTSQLAVYLHKLFGIYQKCKMAHHDILVAPPCSTRVSNNDVVCTLDLQ